MIENKEEILKTRLQKEARRTLNHSKLPKFNTTILYAIQQYCTICTHHSQIQDITFHPIRHFVALSSSTIRATEIRVPLKLAQTPINSSIS